MQYLLAFLSLLMLAGSALSAEFSLQVEGISEEEVLQLGERMYRKGILPSGEPMKAVVMGDIPVDGRMFTCDDCHQRSGLGSVEGTIVTWPTTGLELYKPRQRTGAWRPPESGRAVQSRRRQLPEYWQQIEDVRPPYTAMTLAQVLRTGIDPAGRKLDSAMPLYLLNDREAAILINYLNTLSAETAPGVDAATIRFATVVTEGVLEQDKQAMLAPLQVHIDNHNTQSRHQERRSSSGPFYKTELHQSYRKLELAVWELKGPENTWRNQLEAYYRDSPVFAMLGGISAGSWQPVHDFCEENKVPAIFPVTDLPVVSDLDWYTLYFSKGFHQEGEAVARYLHSIISDSDEVRVVQVARRDARSQALRSGFEENWRKFDRSPPEYLELAPGAQPTGQFWERIMLDPRPIILLLWLDVQDLGKIGTLEQNRTPLRAIVIPGGLLDDSYTIIPDGLRERVYMTSRFNLPGTQRKRRMVVEQWLRARKIPVTDLDIQSRMYFLGWMLSGAIKYIRSQYFREYFLEGFDMMIDQSYAIAVFPRLTFGPGQRYASKGCYIVRLTKGPDPELVQVSDWVIH